jgi:hypothetical protein
MPKTIEATLTIFDDGTFELKDNGGAEIPVVNETPDRYRHGVKMHGNKLPEYINTACWYSGSPI